MGLAVGRKGSREAVVVLVPFPAQGHVTPMVHLAGALCRQGFRAVVALPESVLRRLPAGGSAASEVVFRYLPDGLPETGGANFFAIDRALEETVAPPFEALLRTLDVAFVVFDMLASWAMAAADRCSVPAAGFWPGMLASYDLVCSAPELVRRGVLSSSGRPLKPETRNLPP